MDASIEKKASLSENNIRRVKSADYNAYIIALLRTKMAESNAYFANLSPEALIFRICCLAQIVFVTGFIAVKVPLSLFKLNPTADIVFYAFVFIFCGLVFFIGFLRTAAVMLLVFAGLFLSSVIAVFLCGYIPGANVGIVTVTADALFNIPLLLGVFINIRRTMFEDDIDYFERNGKNISVDSTLSDYAPIGCFPYLLVFGAKMHNPSPYDNAVFISDLVSSARNYRSVMAGSVNTDGAKEYTFYFYSLLPKEKSARFIAKLNSIAKSFHVELTLSEYRRDDDWEVFFENLVPCENENIEIKNRRMMETLFSLGIDFDRAYTLRFCLSATDKSALEKAGEELSAYGFTREEDFESYEGYISCEYSIESFITNRRIEYLSFLMVRCGESCDVKYDGDWMVEY